MLVMTIANREDADLGFVGERLYAHGARFQTVMRDELARLSAPDAGADLVVLLGSDWSVYDPRHHDAVAAEQALVRRAGATGLPVLAICYGAQLVASTLGMTVTRAAVPEIGWGRVQTRDEVLCPPGPWFQLHLDSWTGGRGPATIAHSPAGPQAFRTGRTLAVQFHPEVTAETARRWLHEQPDAVSAAGASLAEIEAGLDTLIPAARLRCHRFVDDFLTLVAQAEMGTARARNVSNRTSATPRKDPIAAGDPAALKGADS
jgi:GMP synthase-like glutamine amidotransferase